MLERLGLGSRDSGFHDAIKVSDGFVELDQRNVIFIGRSALGVKFAIFTLELFEAKRKFADPLGQCEFEQARTRAPLYAGCPL